MDESDINSFDSDNFEDEDDCIDTNSEDEYLDISIEENELSSEDEDYIESDDEENETLNTTTDTVFSNAHEDYDKLIEERGEAPKELKRRNSGVLSRNENVRKRRNENEAEVESELIPIPENFNWSKTLYRRSRPVDFKPTEKPGAVGITKESDPVEVYVDMLKEVLEKVLKFSNDKRKELNDKGAKLKDLTMENIYCFVLAMNWMDTRKLPTMREYFCKDEDLQDRFLCRLRENTGMGQQLIHRMHISLKKIRCLIISCNK